MALLCLSIAWLLIVGGLLARAIGQYRHYEVIRARSERFDEPLPIMNVIVPARNEAENIRRCIEAIRRQDYPNAQLRILIVDDDSQDDTARIAADLARVDPRIRVLMAPALPPGWLGKPNACWHAARHAEGEWLCFIDADTTACPLLLRTALQIARERSLDLLSFQPFQELLSFWERLLLPTGFFVLAFTQDLRRTNDPAMPDASVNGQFMLIRRSVYQQVGGHARVFDQPAEDSALARAIKSSGHRIAVLGTHGLLQTRMYTALPPLWHGTARQAAMLLRSSARLVAVALAALLLAVATLALPAWGLQATISAPTAMNIASLAIALTASASLFGTHIGAARYFRIPFWYGLLFPLGYSLGSAVLLYSAWQYSHRRVIWKGRTYQSQTGPELSHAPHAEGLP